MASRSLSYIAALALVSAAGCNSAAGNKSAPAASAASAAVDTGTRTRTDALVADAAVAEAAGDVLSARHFLEQALDSEPGNAALRTRLLALGGTLPRGDSLLVAQQPAGTPAPATTAPAVSAPTGSAASVLADARPARSRGAARGRRSVQAGGEVERAGAGRGVPAPVEVAARASRLRDSAGHEAARPDAPAADAARSTLADLADARVASAKAHGTTATARRKRTWPWTRAQRWLVAKGIGGGAGAGVVVGAIIGNVPGALLAGSAAGGAVGFKKATKIGPADPYPTQRETAAFEAKRQPQAADSTAAAEQVATSDRRDAEAPRP